MLKNYFKTALRSFWGNKFFSLINIMGLAIGLSAALIIYLIVSYDFHFDKFEKDGTRIYRVVSDYTFSGQSSHSAGVPHAMPAAVKNEVTGLDVVAPFRTWNDGVKVSIPRSEAEEGIVFKKQENIAFVDDNYFKLLQYDWVAGSPRTSLDQPYQIVLTEANAKLYFPQLAADRIIGREVIFNDTVRTVVTGIVKDLGEPTDFTFQSFISRATIELPRLKPGDGDEWGSTNRASQLFVKLSPGITVRQTEKQIDAVFSKYYHPGQQTQHMINTHSLQPLGDVHFNTDYPNFNQRLAHKPTLYGLLALALFLLLLGCINFINLTTAQSSKRAKEIGVRKTMGSSRKQILFQFLSETLLLTFTATLLSLCLMPLLLKAFADFIPPGMHVNLVTQPRWLLFILLLLLAVSLLAGFYPALILSSYKPVLVLKNQAYYHTAKSRGTWLRKSLTVSQFVIAQVFIVATLLVSKQISYTLHKDLGFKKEAILYFETNYHDQDPDHRQALLNKLRDIPGIAMVSLASATPSANRHGSRMLTYRDGKKEVETDAEKIFADTNYTRLYHMKLLAGSNLTYSDTIHGLLINETYAHILGFNTPRQAIGADLEWDKHLHCPVVGVVADFHQRSLRDPIRPLIIASRPPDELVFNIALQPQEAAGTVWKTAISSMEKAFKEVYPRDDFDYKWLDESLANYYTAEQNISRLLKWSTGLAIFISCLGLLGLIVYITTQKTKEIGIRKVVGATALQIVTLLSRDFVKLILIAILIATPIAWYGAHKWLENYAFKTTLNGWSFLAGGVFLLSIALSILCLLTFRAAAASPVKNLRTE